MSSLFDQALSQVREHCSGETLQGRLVGLEKESLRVQPNGRIAQSDHPQALGSALSNRYITTDYSEALLEIVTPPMASSSQALDFLLDAHAFINARLETGEFIWDTSMPCVVDGEDSIRVGEYGDSHAGHMKHVYRSGLGLRYGRVMQAIAGVHFNISLPTGFFGALQPVLAADSSIEQFQTDMYFSASRNLLRNGWLIPYLFGASPAVCHTFLGDRAEQSGLQVYKQHTYYEPYGTSLRMGDIGYQYDKDSELRIDVCCNSLESYVKDLLRLVSTPHAPYAAMGLRDATGAHQQLSTHQLQIENEYYSSVRPKQIADGSEMPLLAMLRRGVRYLELRSVDVNVFEPAGLSEPQLRFLEVFVLANLIAPNLPMTAEERDNGSRNMSLVAHRGREPGLQLHGGSEPVTLRDQGLRIFDQLEATAAWLDSLASTDSTGSGMSSPGYAATVASERAKLDDPELTPSATMLAMMHADYDSFFELAQDFSQRHAASFRERELNAATAAMLEREVAASLAATRELESGSHGSFDAYLARYFAQLDDAQLQPLQSST